MQIDQRALADAAHADQRHHLPGFDDQIDALQDRRVGVSKSTPPKLDFVLQTASPPRIRLMSSIAGFSSNISKTRSAPAMTLDEHWCRFGSSPLNGPYIKNTRGHKRHELALGCGRRRSRSNRHTKPRRRSRRTRAVPSTVKRPPLMRLALSDCLKSFQFSCMKRWSS